MGMSRQQVLGTLVVLFLLVLWVWWKYLRMALGL